MSMSYEGRLRQSVLKTALAHQLKNMEKAPQRTVRNMREILEKFTGTVPGPAFTEEVLLKLVQEKPSQEVLDYILRNLAP